MNIFKIEEIVKFAVQIEKNGEKFYRAVAEKCSDEKLKALFLRLADEEVGHEKTFSVMLGKIEKNELSEAAAEELGEYLKAYTESHIFNRKLPRIDKPGDAIKFAMEAEIASIAYYTEVKNFVQDDEKKVMDEIINEERRHFVKLSQLKI